MIVSPDLAEEARIKALHELEILDTDEEKEYDDLVRLASEVCGTPISLVSLVDEHRQWFKAKVGLTATETHRSQSFCAHAIRQNGIFIVENATEDARFVQNELVTGEFGLRFYAGLPIYAAGGEALGTLCVIDVAPRSLSSEQIEALTILAHQVQARLQLRQQKKQLEHTLAENEALTRRLQASHDLFVAFMRHGPFLSYLKDRDGRYIFYNARIAQHYGVGEADWIGKTDYDLGPSDLADSYRQHDLEVLRTRRPLKFAESSTDASGKATHWNSYKFPIEDASGQLLLAGISVDVTETLEQHRELMRVKEQLELLASTDSLTGLANRRSFEARLEIEFAVSQRKLRTLVLLVLDIDNFKRRNDEFGHAAGDQALAFLGNVLRSCVRTGDLSARIGGEEFAVMMPDSDTKAGLILATRIQKALKDRENAPPNLTVSIGIATTAVPCATRQELVIRADQAMYMAKVAGKDRTVVHSFDQKPT